LSRSAVPRRPGPSHDRDRSLAGPLPTRGVGREAPFVEQRVLTFDTYEVDVEMHRRRFDGAPVGWVDGLPANHADRRTAHSVDLSVLGAAHAAAARTPIAPVRRVLGFADIRRWFRRRPGVTCPASYEPVFGTLAFLSWRLAFPSRSCPTSSTPPPASIFLPWNNANAPATVTIDSNRDFG
jgi:hypothetical protein